MKKLKILVSLVGSLIFFSFVTASATNGNYEIFQNNLQENFFNINMEKGEIKFSAKNQNSSYENIKDLEKYLIKKYNKTKIGHSSNFLDLYDKTFFKDNNNIIADIKQNIADNDNNKNNNEKKLLEFFNPSNIKSIKTNGPDDDFFVFQFKNFNNAPIEKLSQNEIFIKTIKTFLTFLKAKFKEDKFIHDNGEIKFFIGKSDRYDYNRTKDMEQILMENYRNVKIDDSFNIADLFKDCFCEKKIFGDYDFLHPSNIENVYFNAPEYDYFVVKFKNIYPNLSINDDIVVHMKAFFKFFRNKLLKVTLPQQTKLSDKYYEIWPESKYFPAEDHRDLYAFVKSILEESLEYQQKIKSLNFNGKDLFEFYKIAYDVLSKSELLSSEFLNNQLYHYNNIDEIKYRIESDDVVLKFKDGPHIVQNLPYIYFLDKLMCSDSLYNFHNVIRGLISVYIDYMKEQKNKKDEYEKFEDDRNIFKPFNFNNSYENVDNNETKHNNDDNKNDESIFRKLNFEN